LERIGATSASLSSPPASPQSRRVRASFEGVAGRLLGGRGTRSAAAAPASSATAAAASPSSASTQAPKRASASTGAGAGGTATSAAEAPSSQQRRRLRDGGAAVLSSGSSSGRCTPLPPADGGSNERGPSMSPQPGALSGSASSAAASGGTSSGAQASNARSPVMSRGGAFRLNFSQPAAPASPSGQARIGSSASSSTVGAALSAIRALRRASEEEEQVEQAARDAGVASSQGSRPSVALAMARRTRQRAEAQAAEAELDDDDMDNHHHADDRSSQPSREAAGRENRRLQSRGSATATSSRGGDEASVHRQARDDDDAFPMSEMEMHIGVSCDGCGAGPPLRGPVMKCGDCEDFDLCMNCYHERGRLRHPRSHRFFPRTPMEDTPRAEEAYRGGGLVAVLMHLMEEDMLREALMASAAGDVSEAPAEPQEDPEVLAAEALSRCTRIKFSESCCSASCEECALCLDEYTPGEEVLQLKCSHLFHEACLGPWLYRSLSCPMCKADV